jgi:hypothetical protein
VELLATWNMHISEKSQEKAVQMVSRLKTTTYMEGCQEPGLDTLEKRRAGLQNGNGGEKFQKAKVQETVRETSRVL